jgi:hypothetical protein
MVDVARPLRLQPRCARVPVGHPAFDVLVRLCVSFSDHSAPDDARAFRSQVGVPYKLRSPLVVNFRRCGDAWLANTLRAWRNDMHAI